MENTRAPEYYEYITVENGTVLEDEWKLVSVSGGIVKPYMVFRRYIPEDKVAK